MALAKSVDLIRFVLPMIRIGSCFDHADEDTSAITNWFDAGVAKVCVYVDSEEALLELAAKGKALRGFVVALIRTRA